MPLLSQQQYKMIWTLSVVNIPVIHILLTPTLAEPLLGSHISATPGHYPSVYCKLTNVVLDLDKGVFKHRLDGDPRRNFEALCGISSNVWTVVHDESLTDVVCSETYDDGYVFTIYFYYGSNYYHLHYDMMIPLFSELRHQDDRKRIALMPSVESSRLQAIFWDTEAFKDKSKYWYQMLEVLSSPHDLVPLDRNLASTKKNICFKVINFGTPAYFSDDRSVMLPYVQFIKSKLGVEHRDIATKKVGLIRRTNRRRILNEEELINAVSEFAEIELVEFSGLSFKEQVGKVQEYAVLAGMNGAGLMNGLFLSEGAVSVQLVPYNATLNFDEFGRLLKSRGSYLEWHNKHADLSREIANDPYHGQSDTQVKVEEFVRLIKEALSLTAGDKHTEL